MKFRLLMSLVLVVPLFAVGAVGPVSALDVTARVTIERIRALDNFGTDLFPEDADFYAVVNINGTEFDNKNTPSQDAQRGRRRHQSELGVLARDRREPGHHPGDDRHLRRGRVPARR